MTDLVKPIELLQEAKGHLSKTLEDDSADIEEVIDELENAVYKITVVSRMLYEALNEEVG